jgi:hypothetical protein
MCLLGKLSANISSAYRHCITILPRNMYSSTQFKSNSHFIPSSLILEKQEFIHEFLAAHGIALRRIRRSLRSSYAVFRTTTPLPTDPVGVEAKDRAVDWVHNSSTMYCKVLCSAWPTVRTITSNSMSDGIALDIGVLDRFVLYGSLLGFHYASVCWGFITRVFVGFHYHKSCAILIAYYLFLLRTFAISIYNDVDVEVMHNQSKQIMK